MRCLILSCSRNKRSDLEPLPAVERYTGPPFQVLNKFLRDYPSAAKQLDIYILSARFGLLQSHELIDDYDQKMTPALAHQMRRHVLSKVKNEILSKKYNEIYLSMGKTYRLAIAGIEDMVTPPTELVISDETAGKKLTALRSWLRGSKGSIQKKPIQKIAAPKSEPVNVVLRGRQVNLTTADVINQLQKEIKAAKSNKTARNVRKWYVEVAGERLSPKWAVATLFDLPVSEFTADEARRVLGQLGLNCHQT